MLKIETKRSEKKNYEGKQSKFRLTPRMERICQMIANAEASFWGWCMFNDNSEFKISFRIVQVHTGISWHFHTGTREETKYWYFVCTFSVLLLPRVLRYLREDKLFWRSRGRMGFGRRRRGMDAWLVRSKKKYAKELSQEMTKYGISFTSSMASFINTVAVNSGRLQSKGRTGKARVTSVWWRQQGAKRLHAWRSLLPTSQGEKLQCHSGNRAR